MVDHLLSPPLSSLSCQNWKMLRNIMPFFSSTTTTQNNLAKKSHRKLFVQTFSSLFYLPPPTNQTQTQFTYMASRKKANAARGKDRKQKPKAAKDPPKKKAVKNPHSSADPDGGSLTPPAKKSKCNVELIPPTKAFVDKNEYKVIELPNKVRALLIHQANKTVEPKGCPISFKSKGMENTMKLSTFDMEHKFTGFSLHMSTPPTNTCGSESLYEDPPFNNVGINGNGRDTTASVSIVFNVGALNDKPFRSGIAHFTEHMVHYGSKKYPDEYQVMKYAMSKCHGWGAHTTPTYTAYYYTMSSQTLEEGLDLLTNSIASPTFEQDMIRREVHAVDNEFARSQHIDIWALFYILWSLAKKDHPLNMFSCGNLQTLLPRDDAKGLVSLKKDLDNFHSQNYVGSAMTLAIQSNDSLQNLERMVSDHFAKIPQGCKSIRKDTKIPQEHMDPYETKEFKKMYIVTGKQSQPYIFINWALPAEVWKDYHHKPFEFWGTLIEDQREHGLGYKLRHEGIISGMSASLLDINSLGAPVFQVEIRLSPWFLVQSCGEPLPVKFMSLVERLFEYLGELRKTSSQYKNDQWIDFSSSKNIYFENTMPHEGKNFTLECASALQDFPESEIFSSAKVVTEYDDDHLNQVLEMLTPSNMNLIAIVPEDILETYYSQSMKSCKKKMEEPFTKTIYYVEDFPTRFTKCLGTLLNKGKPLTILKNPFCTRICDRRNCAYKMAPKIICLNDKCCVFHQGNYGPDWMTATCSITIHTPLEIIRYHHPNLCKLLILKTCVEFIVCPFTNLIEKSGMNMLIFEHNGCLHLHFEGFPEQLPLAIGNVLPHIFPPNGKEGFTQAVFEIAKSIVLGHASDKLGDANWLAAKLIIEVITRNAPSFRNTIETMSNIAYENFANFTQLYANCSFVEVNLFGNVSPIVGDQIGYIVNLLANFPNISGWEHSLTKPELISRLPYETRCIRVASGYRKEKNCIVQNVYQFHKLPGYEVESIIRFLGLYMAAPFFYIMRTQQQLGYELGIYPMFGFLQTPILVARVTFPAEKRTLCQVDKDIDTFFVSFEEFHLRHLTDEEFKMQKQFWNISKELTLNDVKSYYKQTFLCHIKAWGSGDGSKFWSYAPGRISKLSIQILGKDDEKCKDVAHCHRSRWSKVVGEEKQKISFTRDEYDTGSKYFIEDPQRSRDSNFK